VSCGVNAPTEKKAARPACIPAKRRFSDHETGSAILRGKRAIATRPKVERKLGHLMQRRHGGRRARVRGRARVMHDFALLAAADNLRRLAKLGVHYDGTTWTR